MFLRMGKKADIPKTFLKKLIKNKLKIPLCIRRQVKKKRWKKTNEFLWHAFLGNIEKKENLMRYTIKKRN